MTVGKVLELIRKKYNIFMIFGLSSFFMFNNQRHLSIKFDSILRSTVTFPNNDAKWVHHFVSVGVHLFQYGFLIILYLGNLSMTLFLTVYFLFIFFHVFIEKSPV